MPSSDEESREMGAQPLDDLMKARNLENSDLVRASLEQLTHKQVQKARRGRRVTKNIQHKVQRAIIQAENVKREASGGKLVDEEWLPLHKLFTYGSQQTR